MRPLINRLKSQRASPAELYLRDPHKRNPPYFHSFLMDMFFSLSFCMTWRKRALSYKLGEWRPYPLCSRATNNKGRKEGGLYLGYCHLKVLLGDMDSPFPQGIHASFSAYTLSRERKTKPVGVPLNPELPASASIPLGTLLTFTSAPDAPGMSSAIFLRLIPRVRFIFREWIFKMSSRA